MLRFHRILTYPGDVSEEVERDLVVDEGDQRLHDAQADDVVSQLRPVADDISCAEKNGHIVGSQTGDKVPRPNGTAIQTMSDGCLLRISGDHSEAG